MFRVGSALLRSTASSATPTAATSSLLVARSAPLRGFSALPPLRQNERPPASPLTDAASPSEPTEEKACAGATASSAPSSSSSSKPSSASPSSSAHLPGSSSSGGAWANVHAALGPSSPDSSSSSSPNDPYSFSNTPESHLARQEEAWAERSLYKWTPQIVTPSTGRTVLVNNNFERSFSRLRGILSRNKVVQELKMGERYEKPNQERRRKMSERHRRRFADMIRQKVRLVMELKNRGG